MEIRKFREEDREKKQRMHEETVKKINSRDYSEEQVDAWTSYDDAQSEDENKERWVAEENGEIIGFGDYSFEEGEITGLYVHPDHLRKGIGSKLLTKIEEDARERGLEKLECTSSITAKDFYESHGYKVVEEATHETNGEELEAFKMEKQLST